MTQTYLLALIVIAVAACLQASLGFGFALTTMALLPFLFEYSRALAMTQIIGIVSSIYLAVRYRRFIRFDVLLPFLIPTLIVQMFTTIYSVKAPGQSLFILLGVVLIGFSLWFLAFSEKIRFKPTRKVGVTAGLVCGVTSGLFSIGGPPAALYLLPALNDKNQYQATMQAFFVIISVESLTIRILMGSLSVSDIPFIAAGWGAMLAGTLVGIVLFDRIRTPILKKAVYVLVGLNGLWIVISRFIRPL